MMTQPTVRRRRRWLRRVVVTIVTLVVLIPGLCFLMKRSAQSRWDRLAADIRAKGQPLTYADLAAAEPDRADKDNGALIVTRAIRRLEEITEPDSTGVLVLDQKCACDYFDGIDRSCLPATRAYLDARRPALAVLGELPNYTQSRLTIPLDMSPMDRASALLKVLSSYRQVAKLLYLDGTIHVIDGETSGAVDAIIQSLHTTESLYAEPALIAQLVAIAMDALTASSVEGLLLAHELPGDQLQRLQREWTTHLSKRTIRPALLGERASIIGLLDLDRHRAEAETRRSQTKSVPDSDWDLSNALRRLPFITDWWIIENRVSAVAAITRVVDASKNLRPLLEAVQHELDAVPKYDPRDATLRILFPSLARSVVLYARCTAQANCVRVALAAERFRLERGQFPDQAANLVPGFLAAIPEDPFDGQPLRYRRTVDGVVIYTIGDDMVDDGGKVAPRSTQGSDRARDFGIRLLDPEKRGLRFIETTKDATHE